MFPMDILQPIPATPRRPRLLLRPSALGFPSALGPRPSDFNLALLCCLAALLLACVNPALAQAPAAAFDAANKLYEEGKFSEAAVAYEKLAEGGRVSAALYFNLGNAFFKSGRMGQAIAAYRQAARLTPRDPDVRANLQFARNQTQGPTLSSTRWQRWLARLNLNEWTLLAAAPFWLWLLLLALVQWRPALKPALRNALVGLALAVVVFGACLAAAFYEDHITRTAIVIVPEAVVRHGPLDVSQDAFTVHDGAELRVLDQKDEWLEVSWDPHRRKDEWLEVSYDPRRIGWLRRDQVLVPK
jgi:tetratricopeptide (TPR) repeat protein